MTNYESLTNLCHRLPPLTNSLAPTDNKDSLGNPNNLRDTLGQDFMKIPHAKTSNDVKRRKTVNGISKKHTKNSSATKISSKLHKLRQSVIDLNQNPSQNSNRFPAESGLKPFRAT